MGTIQIQTDFSALIKIYEQLDPTEYSSKLEFERSKLKLIQSIESILQRDLHFLVSHELSYSTQNPTLLSTYWQTIGYYLLMILGLTINSIKAYVSVNFLISLIPGLIQPVQIVLSIIFVFLQGVLFYGFEISMLKAAFGLPVSSTDLHLLINIYLEQLQAIRTINRLLSVSLGFVGDARSQEQIKLIEMLNADIQKKHTSIQAHENALTTKILMFATIAIGMLTSISGSYFVYTMILNTLALSLVSTPIGIFLIILATFVDLGFYYALGVSGMVRWMNADFNRFDFLKKEIDVFKQEYSCQFWTEIKTQRNRVSIKESHDVAIQTEPQFFESMTL